MTDIMLDIETLGLKPGSIVLSVGAVTFDRRTGEMRDTFYRTIDAMNSEAHGLRIEAGTALWWLEQEAASRSDAASGGQMLRHAALEFVDFLEIVAPENDAIIWTQGDMDLPVWGAAMLAAGVTPPWRYNAFRDTRTAYDLCNFDPKSVERIGTYHNALDDARHQVRCLHAAMRDIIGDAE